MWTGGCTTRRRVRDKGSNPHGSYNRASSEADVESHLADDQPVVTVVIPVRNAASVIGEQLEALSRQDFDGPWEVVISDNGSEDGLVDVVDATKSKIPALRIIDSSGTRGAGAARNAGLRHARGRLVAFCDADDHVTSDWLTVMVRALKTHPFVAGGLDHESLNPWPSSAWHYRSHVDSVPIGSRFKPYAVSSNMGVWRSALEEIGGFPEDMEVRGSAAGEDIAVSWNLQLAGYPLHFEPGAVVSYRHRRDLRSLWKQQVAYGYAEVVLYSRFRDHGVPRSRLWGAFRSYLRLLLRLPALRRPDTRGSWIGATAKRYGRLLGSLRERVLYL